jgi:hypothetical protein
MGILIVLVTQILKWLLIKPFTNKLKNKKVKSVINTIIVFIAIGLGFLAEYLYSYKYLHHEFSVMEALGWSGAGQIAYAFLERFIKMFDSKKTIENPYTTEEGKAVISLVENLTKDGKIDGKDMPMVQEFLKSLENK